jgi:fibronectin-binding autotransporter adhesin
MKPKFHKLLIASTVLFAAMHVHADTLYWDGNDTTADSDGGTGTWDNVTTFNWDSLPVAGTASQWDNSNIDTAIFGRSSGTVTLGDDITVGGIRFDTSGYTINALTNSKTLTLGATDNTISFGTGAISGTITGAIAGTGNFILSGNPTVASTLTLNNTGNGWFGTTTVNAGSTLSIGQTSTALSNTSSIAINGGRIYVQSDGATAGNQVSSTAGITFNGGGTYEQRHQTAIGNTTQTLGAVTVNSGQANFLFNNATSSSNNVINLTSLTRSVNTATLNFGTAYSGASLNNKYAVSGAGTTTAGEIIGAWATSGLTGANQLDYAVYSSDAVIGADIAASAESTWSTTHAATSNYTLTNAAGSAVDGLLTATRNINTLRNTTTATAATATNGGAANLDYYTLAGNAFANGDVVSASGTSGTTAGVPYYVVNVGVNGANTFQISTTSNLIAPTLVNLGNTTAGQIAGGITLSSGNDLGTTGILNGSTTTLAIGGSGTGVVTLPTTASGELFVTAGAGAIAIDAPITDNGAGVLSLVKSGNAALRLSGANTFTGDITINAGSLTFSSLTAGMDGTGKNISFGGVGSLDTGANGWDGGQLTVAAGAVGSIRGLTTDFTSTTGSGTVIIGAGNTTFNLGDASAFTGSIRKDAGGNGGVVQFSALGDASGAGNLIFAVGSGDSNQRITMRYAGTSALTFDNRSIELQPKPNNWSVRNSILENNSANSAHTWVINTDLINQNDRNHEFTLSGSNTGDNEFAGVISNSARGTYYAANTGELNLYKAGTGKWIVSGENTFTGRVLVNQGTLSVGDFTNSGVAGALGMGSLIQLGGSDRNFINNNALFSSNTSGTLEYTGGAATSDRVFEIGDTLAGGTGGGTIANNGTGAATFSAATFNSTITGITATRTLTLGGTNTDYNEIQGIIQDNSGTGQVALTKADAGIWTLSGNNSYTGATAVNGGILNFANVAAKSSGTTVTAGASGTVGLGVKTSDASYYSAADVGDLFNTDTLSGFTLNAASGVAFDTTNAGGSFDQTVALTAARSLTKLGTGTLILSQTNTYTGATTVSVGTLLVNGSIASSSLTTVASGATIGGSGTIGALTVSSGGFINPGNSPDILTVVGDYTQAGLYTAEITGLTAGATGHDQIGVTGAVDITGGSLTAMFSAGSYTAGDLIFILLNDSTDAITGTYASLADGAKVTSHDGLDWTISYFADSGTTSFTGGNDIALLAVAPIPEPRAALLACLGVLLLLRRRR